MIIVEASAEFWHCSPNPERICERAARTCYQSTHKIKECEICAGSGLRGVTRHTIDGNIERLPCPECNGTGTDISSARHIIKTVIDNGHESVLEHPCAGFIITTDRGITHEIVRHRIGVAYSQESTRYCNYSLEKGAFCGEIKVIEPPGLKPEGADDSELYQIWDEAIRASEAAYNKMTALGCPPQIARSVLPNSLKAEICVTMNFRAWRHFLDLRTSAKAHPQIQQVAEMIRVKLLELAPSCFENFHEAH